MNKQTIWQDSLWQSTPREFTSWYATHFPLAEPMTENKKDWSTGVKFDGGKPRMDLLDPDFLAHVAQVLTFGAQKYDAHNWRKGINTSRLIAASYRHLGAINNGEDVDPESGLPHSAHLGCCVMFLDWMLANRKDLDDRWKND